MQNVSVILSLCELMIRNPIENMLSLIFMYKMPNKFAMCLRYKFPCDRDNPDILPLINILYVLILTICSRFLISDDRVATLVDLVLRIGTKLASLVPNIILGMVLDLTKRYSSPGCLLLLLNVPHNMFAMQSRL